MKYSDHKKFPSGNPLIRIVLCFFALAFQFTGLNAGTSNIKFGQLKVKDGLSQSWVTCICQDSYGFMWFGTGGNGVNKYDGYEFQVYKNNPRKEHSLTNNLINAIYEDSKRNLWVGTQLGLNLYDREQDCFKGFPELQSVYVTGFYETDRNVLFVSTINNIYEINLDDHSVIRYCEEFGGCLQGIFADAIVEGAQGNLWQGSSQGLYLLDTLNRAYTIFRHDAANPNSLGDDVITSMAKDTQGRIWMGTESGGLSLMQRYNDGSGQPEFINFMHNPSDKNSISDGSVLAMLDDGKGNLWIGIENGGLDILDLHELESGNIRFIHYKNDIDDETSISYNSIYSLFRDDQETIWIGTYGGGLSYYNELLFKFDHYTYKNSRSGSISNNIVNVIYKGSDYFWIGTEGGLNILNFRSNTIDDFTHYGNTRLGIGKNAVWAILEDSRQNLWIGTWAGGLFVYNKISGKVTRFRNDPDDPQSISSDNVFGILEGKDGYLWIATMNGGLDRYDYKTNTFKSYRVDFTNQNSISGDWVRTLLEDTYGELWISTSSGISLFDRKAGEFINFTNDPDNLKSISYSSAIVLFEDSKRNIWLGTEAGLNAFIREDTSFIHYQEVDGLPDNSVKGICEDDHGNLWLSTNKGISKFVDGINKPEKPAFVNYSMDDGLLGDEFNRRASYKDENGFLYFGGIKGLDVFHPDSLKKNTYEPPVVLTDFLLFNKPVAINAKDSPLKKHIGITDEIVLSHDQSVITLKFAALNYLFPEKNCYKYLLKGFDEQWNDVGTKREATYTNLDPGKYYFQVRGSNSDGVWNDKGVSLKITILPPWYRTIAAIIFEVLLFIGLLMTIYYIRVRGLRMQKFRLENLVNVRTQEIKNKNQILHNQAAELNEANVILEEKQQQIEEQNEMLLDKTKKLNDTNKLLGKRQEFIRNQAEKLIQTNDTLKTLNATKDKFFSIIAHDLKNPFNSILGFCEIVLLKYDSMEEEKKKKLIEVVYESAQNVYELLENLLQWSRSQTGNIQFKPELFVINEVIKVNISLTNNLIKEKNLSIEYNPEKDIEVYADKNMINTILRNLITNAVKFTEEGGIVIEVSEKRSKVEVLVKDSGVGIEKDKLDTLFEIGMSKSTQGTRGETGTGLGLILCKEFIQKNGGELFVTSEEGKGSTFGFSLPAKK
jgi:signal transduction histidine kinase/ligand-binding sensor domain-containing protein